MKSGHKDYDEAMNNHTHLVTFIAVVVDSKCRFVAGCSAERR